MTMLRKYVMVNFKMWVQAVITKTYFFKLKPMLFLTIFSLIYKSKLQAHKWLSKKKKKLDRGRDVFNFKKF